jgi:hypothetical protein
MMGGRGHGKWLSESNPKSKASFPSPFGEGAIQKP